MSAPFFSVVIPTFNRSDLFPLAVRSILRQTFTDFEVIVSDNCSTDDTPKVAQQFKDSRVKYARTPHHVFISDSWEFARLQATGRLILMLSDDDAMTSTALERFAHEATQRDADFLFCGVAQYRDATYPGPERNSADCPAFSGRSRVVSVEEFVGPLFGFRPTFDMHPSAFVFAKAIADEIQARTGRFFWTNGVEFSAWPMSAVFARRMVHIDAPLNVLGRTGKSWGSNTQLCNPGKEQIQTFIKDVDREWKFAPLKNFTTSNLMIEGMLTAKSLFPKEFEAFSVDEAQYLRSAMQDLRKRQSLGVDVAVEIADLKQYSAKYPSLLDEFNAWHAQAQPSRTSALLQNLRLMVGDLGARAVRRRLHARQVTRKLEQGTLRSGFFASGDQFGFADILGCAEFLGRACRAPEKEY